MELHSHKTQKGQLHKDIAQRLNRKYEDAKGLYSEIEDLNRERLKLLQFSHLANKTGGPNSEKIHEIFWILEKLRTELPEIPIRFSIKNASTLTHGQINEHIGKLEDVARLRGELPDSIIDTWAGFKPKGIVPGDDEKIRLALLSLRNEFDRLSAYIEQNEGVIEKAGVYLTIGLLRLLTNVDVTVIDSKPADFDEKVAIKFLEAKNLELLTRLDEAIRQYSKLMIEARRIAEDLDTLSVQQTSELVRVTDALVEASYGDKRPPQLEHILNELAVIIEYIQMIQGDAALVQDCFHEPPTKIDDILRVMQIHELIMDAPLNLEIHRYHGHVFEIAGDLVEDACQECMHLLSEYNQVCEVFVPKQIPDREQLIDLARTLRKHRKSLFAFLSGEFRKTKKTVKTFLVDDRTSKLLELPELLEQLADTLQRIEAIKQNKDYAHVLGPLFGGIETDWDSLKKVVRWTQELKAAVASPAIVLSLLQNFSDVRERFVRVGPKIQKNYGLVSNKLKTLGITLSYSSEIEHEIGKLNNLNDAIKDVLRELPQSQACVGLEITTINVCAKAYLSALDLKNRVTEDKTLEPLLGAHVNGVQTDTQTLLSMAEWVGNLVIKSGLPKSIIQWFLESQIDTKLSLLKELLAINGALIQTLDKTYAELYGFGTIDTLRFFGDDDSHWLTVRDKITAYVDCAQYLLILSDYYRCMDEANGLGLKDLTDLIHSRRVNFEHCSSLYKYIVYGGIIKELINEHSELASFTGVTYENAISRFVTLDRQLMNKMTKHIAYKVGQNPVPLGIGVGPVKDHTNRCLLMNELQKKKKHIPIRQLVRRAGRALKALKPCFMMSPLSVAQYLASGQIEFDLVIMDEASQIRPADAMGAIARAKQLVIVGDPNQLPPTSFFERLGGDEYAEDAYAVTDMESILDRCMAVYPKRRLRWHYRSRHESLIAFSNYHFYDNDLILFPTNQKDQRIYGVKHHYIEGATYLKRRNKDEATAVVQAIIKHFRDHSGESIGVATFNREQSELIQDILERFQKSDQWLESMTKESENSSEPFFIKNLENVQGDERDVIFISTTFGPDPAAGRVYQRFGPIAEEVGWRRLNVIVTRAKKRVEVFTSMRSTDIHLTENSSRGVRSLKAYLEYAEKGTLSDWGVEKPGHEPGSDFEISVSRVLRTYGYNVIPQVGVAGFFIDIGVRHPHRKNEYILGVECDGATYHSAKSVRDRDRLRQEILETKGWKIHRIWSVDWFKNREKEIKRMLNVISGILDKEKPEVTIVQEEAVEEERAMRTREVYATAVKDTTSSRKMEDQLREELSLYRNSNIQPRFPDIKNSILRSEILELFVTHRPTTKEEFYQFVPENLRTSTDGKQMQFLEDILEIIEGYAD